MLVTEFGMIVFLIPNIRVFVLVSIIALQLFLLSYLGLPFSTVIVESSGQPENASFSMLVTEFGIVI